MKSTATMKKTLVLSIAIASVTAGQVQAAEKGVSDVKIYPGSICVLSQKDYGNVFDRLKYSLDGGFEVRETSSDITEVVCPVIRDNVYSALGISTARVYFEDHNPYSNLSCYIQSWDLSGNKPLRHSSTQSNSGTKEKGYFKWRRPISSSSNTSFYTVNCKVPGKYNGLTSRIVSIKIGESY